MNNFEKNETLRQLRKMHEKFGQEIAVERKNGALLRYGEIKPESYLCLSCKHYKPRKGECKK